MGLRALHWLEGVMPISASGIWTALFPLSGKEFVDRVSAPDSHVQRVRIRVTATCFDGDRFYSIVYEGLEGASVVLRAKERMSTAEMRQALLHYDSDIPEDLDTTVERRVRGTVGDAETRILQRKVPVTVEYK